MKKSNYLSLVLFAIGAIMFTGCKKSESVIMPPELANFTNRTVGTYLITGPAVTYKIPVGITTISSEPRTVNVIVTSPTGAVEGTHYTLSGKSLVIPAGKAVDSITVQGVFAQYQSGRKDSLIFTIVEPGAPPAEYNNKFSLFMRGPCFATDINTDLSSLLGTYAKTNELLGTQAYGPYTTTISSATKTGATTADIMVTNIYDDNPDWNPLKFTLDWSDLTNIKVTLLQQTAGGNAGNTFGAQYAGQAHAVRPVPGGATVGSLDFCGQKLTLRMNVGIAGVGFSSTLYTVVLER